MLSEGNYVVENSLQPRRNLDTGARQDHSDATLSLILEDWNEPGMRGTSEEPHTEKTQQTKRS